jgi:hypothetical protein
MLRNSPAPMRPKSRYWPSIAIKAIEHVHVYEGAQAAFIASSTPGEGVGKIGKVQPHAFAAQLPALPCSDPTRARALPIAGNAKRLCRMHGGPSPGAPKGNQNAFKHGRYSAAAMRERRLFADLIREMRGTAGAGA